jgi:predicted ArsR family transcriptional regulator
VDELASALGLTDNAVRLHLGTLERDGLVRRASVRRGVGKPAHVYELSTEAERALSHAYAPVLATLLDELGQRMDSAELEGVLRDVGRRLAEGHVTRTGTPLSRAQTAARLLGSLGGDVEGEQDGQKLVLRGHGCPLAEATSRHPEACRIVERLVGDVVGGRARERCEHGDRPRCRVEVSVRSEG